MAFSREDAKEITGRIESISSEINRFISDVYIFHENDPKEESSNAVEPESRDVGKEVDTAHWYWVKGMVSGLGRLLSGIIWFCANERNKGLGLFEFGVFSVEYSEERAKAKENPNIRCHPSASNSPKVQFELPDLREDLKLLKTNPSQKIVDDIEKLLLCGPTDFGRFLKIFFEVKYEILECFEKLTTQEPKVE